MISSIVEDHKSLQNNIGKIIENSGYRLEYISEKMGMDKTSFYLKKNNTDFTVDEIERLLNVIHAEDLEDEILLKMSLEAEKDAEYVELKDGLL